METARPELAQILFIDFVGFSQLFTDRQHEIKQILQSEVRSCPEYQRARESGELIVRDTGDGFAFVLRSNDPEAAPRLAVELATAFAKRDGVFVRMGINTGPVIVGVDLDGALNVTGPGINEAQRLMDCGDAGHILVGESTARSLVGLTGWSASLQDLGEHTVKHGLSLRVFRLAKDGAGSQAPLVRKSAAPEAASVVVLPLSDTSADPDNEYFSDGLAEEIINVLAKTNGLKVIARTSAFAFKGKNVDVREIARALGVAHVLEGSVRKAVNRIRIAVQLILASAGTQVWSERFDATLDDVFEVQDRIATEIASSLRITLVARRNHTPVPAAYDALLKAKHHLHQSSPEHALRARQYSEQAIALDPSYAHAYSVLAQGYFYPVMYGAANAREVLPKVREIGLQAVAADPTMGEGHAMLGLVSAYLDLDWQAAGAHFERAMADDPPSTDSRRYWAFSYLLPQGRTAEATEQLRRALEEDPLHPNLHFQLAVSLHANGQTELSLQQMNRLRDLHEGVFFPHVGLSVFHAALGDYASALAPAKRALELAPWNDVCVATYAALAMRCGLEEEGRATFARLAGNPSASLAIAAYHAMLNEWDLAFPLWELCAEARDPRLFTTLFFYRPVLKDHPRWLALMSKLGLPS